MDNVVFRGDGPGEMGLNLPYLVFGTTFIPVQLSAGQYAVCAVSANHECQCWGYGALMGQGNTENVFDPTPVDLGGGFDAEFVSVGLASACAVSTTGKMKVCDFRNAFGSRYNWGRPNVKLFCSFCVCPAITVHIQSIQRDKSAKIQNILPV